MGGGGPLSAPSPAAEWPLRVRWLGRVAYRDALALQKALLIDHDQNHLLLLEHPHVVTMSRRTPADHLLVDVEALGAELVEVDRGGDVTYHGPGQLVGYPILDLPGKRGGGMADTAAYVHSLEQLLIDGLAEVGLSTGRLDRCTGVWVEPDGPRPRKIAAIGVRIERARSMHGFALNVDPDLEWFSRIVPCGITDKGVTSLRAEGIDVAMSEIVDLLVRRVADAFGFSGRLDRADVTWRTLEDPKGLHTRRVEGTAVELRSRKPEWMRAPLDTGPEFRRIRATMRALDLVTVCEEAGCPNMSECWNDGTATFMILGDRCTRACGFCLIDTRRPLPPDPDEPARVAAAVTRMGLRHAVITMVARDDLPDGGAAAVAATVAAIRRCSPDCRVETLVSDVKGDDAALAVLFAAEPDVFNHNIETVARLQRVVRPSAGYARSLSVLARAKSAGLITKSSIIVGMGETEREVEQTLADLASVGTDIVTIGQYLRPTARHLAVSRWWDPSVFASWKDYGEARGISHVESSPLTRSSYHAREAAEAAGGR